ncbi:MAG: YjbH domain-containing protein, partial [Armatimonadetes bacterium]|nr:YjbH domain-containing protein [Armatimonadota bacterium]
TTMFGLGYSVPLAYLPTRPLQSAVPAASGATDSATDAMERIKAALVESGLEDVQVTVTHIGEGKELAVAYEDRCYTVNQLDGLPDVLRTMAEHAPPETEALAVMLRRRGLVMAEYRVPVEAYRRYVEGKMTGPEFARAAEITALPKTNEMRGPQQTTDIANLSVGHTDIVVSPGIRNVIGTEVGAFRVGVLGRVEAVTQLGRGLQSQARWVYPLGGELVAEDAPRLRNDRYLLSYAFVPKPGTLAQIIAGKFPGDTDGLVLEVLHPLTKRIVLHGVAGRAESERLGKQLYWIAECWYMIPKWKTQIRLLGGRFLSADTGIGIDLIRSFGAVELGIGVRDTSTSRVVEARISMPLSPRKQPQAPSRVRIRLADYYDHSLRSVIKGVNYLYLENVTARELVLGPDLRETFLSRYRLLPDSGCWPGQ